MFGVNFEKPEYNPYYLKLLLYLRPQIDLGKGFYIMGYANGGLFFYYPYPQERAVFRRKTEIYPGLEGGGGFGYETMEIKFIYIPEFKKSQVFQIIAAIRF